MNSAARNGPVKLGQLELMGSPVPSTRKFKGEAAAHDLDGVPVAVSPVAPDRRLKIIIALVVVAVAALVVVAALMGTGTLSGPASSTATDPNANNTKPDNDITSSPTAPTVPATFKPTHSPTFKPIATPTIPTTNRPTLGPTFAPTLAPQRLCETPEALCGCDIEVVELVDVIFVIDESASVGSANYALIKSAISNFAQTVQPPFNLVNGTRIGIVEFDLSSHETIDLSQFSTLSAWLTQYAKHTFGASNTNHKAGLEAVEAMLGRSGNELRSGSQLAIVMITDGVPCLICSTNQCKSGSGTCMPGIGNGDCCSLSFQLFGGTEVLARLRDAYDFTFYFLPVQPAGNTNDANITQFDGIMPADRYVKFNNTAFEDLNSFLNGEAFSVVLDPCVSPPTLSRADIRLLEIQNDDNQLSYRLDAFEDIIMV